MHPWECPDRSHLMLRTRSGGKPLWRTSSLLVEKDRIPGLRYPVALKLKGDTIQYGPQVLTSYKRTTSKWPPSYGVSWGPGNDPFRWKGDSSMGSILMPEVLSFLQSALVSHQWGVFVQRSIPEISLLTLRSLASITAVDGQQIGDRWVVIRHHVIFLRSCVLLLMLLASPWESRLHQAALFVMKVYIYVE